MNRPKKSAQAKRTTAPNASTKATKVQTTQLQDAKKSYIATTPKHWYQNKVFDAFIGVVVILGFTTIGCEEGAHVVGKRAFFTVCSWLSPQPGDEFLTEPTYPLDLREFCKHPWVNEVWIDTANPKTKIYVLSGKHSVDQEIVVAVDGLDTGDHTMRLFFCSEHTYRGRTFCNEHGGAVTDENSSILIRLSDNRIRMILPLTNGAVHDRVFHRKR